MADATVDLLQGTLDLLILKALALGPLHGWAIAKRIQQMSRDVLTVEPGIALPGALPTRGARTHRERARRLAGRPPHHALQADRRPDESSSPHEDRNVGDVRRRRCARDSPCVTSTVSARARDAPRTAGRSGALASKRRWTTRCATTSSARSPSACARGMTPDEARRTALRDFGGIETSQGRRAATRADSAARRRRARRRLRPSRPSPAVQDSPPPSCSPSRSASAARRRSSVSSTASCFVHCRTPSPARLVALWERNDARNVDQNVVSVADLRGVARATRSFSDIACAHSESRSRSTAHPPSDVMGAAGLARRTSRLLGVHPAIGRDFTSRRGGERRRAGRDPQRRALARALWREPRHRRTHDLDGRSTVHGRRRDAGGVRPAAVRLDRPSIRCWLPFGITEGNRSWGRVPPRRRAARAGSLDRAARGRSSRRCTRTLATRVGSRNKDGRRRSYRSTDADRRRCSEAAHRSVRGRGSASVDGGVTSAVSDGIHATDGSTSSSSGARSGATPSRLVRQQLVAELLLGAGRHGGRAR